MKKKLNLASMEAQKLNANEMKNVNGGWVIAWEKSAWAFEGWCWCGSSSCGNEGNAAAKANDDRIGDREC